MGREVGNAVGGMGNMLGDSMYYGRGAGKLPTASAVVSDVIDCARHQGTTIMCFWDNEEAKLIDIGEIERSFFIRAKKEALPTLKEVFEGGQEIIIEGRNDVGYITLPIQEKVFKAKYEALNDNVYSRIRIES